MYQVQREIKGFVKIHRCPNGKYRFTGLNVMGRDRKGQLANRLLWLHHQVDDWFRDLCNEYADTNFQVEMRVEKKHNTGVALVVPVASSKEEALRVYKVRYGHNVVPNTTEVKKTEVVVEDLPPTAFDNAFKAHEFAAKLYDMEVLEHVPFGLTSYTRTKHKKTGRFYRLVGGMLINKVVKVYNPEDPAWRMALSSFVRHKDEE